MVLTTRSGRRASQRGDELSRFIDILRCEGVTRYLEIGARHGDTFFEVMSALPVGSIGCAVDMPGGRWGALQSREALAAAVEDLNADGHQTSVVFGDSKAAAVRQQVMRSGPFDAVFIDGDHLYDGVKADWENYGGMGRIVAFHDIDGEGQQSKQGDQVQVPRLWNEIRGDFQHIEIIGADRGMGIGVIFR